MTLVMSGFNSRLVLHVLFFSVFGIASLNSQTLDSVMFSTFCDRTLTETAFKLCSYSTATDSEINYFGSDLFSVAPSGQLLTYGVQDTTKPKNNMPSSFSVMPVNVEWVKIDCVTDYNYYINPIYNDAAIAAGLVGSAMNLAPLSAYILPWSSEDLPLHLVSGPQYNNGVLTGYTMSGTFRKGATITYYSHIALYCEWQPAN